MRNATQGNFPHVEYTVNIPVFAMEWRIALSPRYETAIISREWRDITRRGRQRATTALVIRATRIVPFRLISVFPRKFIIKVALVSIAPPTVRPTVLHCFPWRYRATHHAPCKFKYWSLGPSCVFGIPFPGIFDWINDFFWKLYCLE